MRRDDTGKPDKKRVYLSHRVIFYTPTGSKCWLTKEVFFNDYGNLATFVCQETGELVSVSAPFVVCQATDLEVTHSGQL